jgi:hypothetical protein
VKTEPLLDPLRKEPRFQAIERELKFPNRARPNAEGTLPDSGRPTVRSREIYRLSTSGGEWPTAPSRPRTT